MPAFTLPAKRRGGSPIGLMKMLETLQMTYLHALDRNSLDWPPRLSEREQRLLGRRLASYWDDRDTPFKQRHLRRRAKQERDHHLPLQSP